MHCFSICACHPCARAILIFSVSFQSHRVISVEYPMPARTQEHVRSAPTARHTPEASREGRPQPPTAPRRRRARDPEPGRFQPPGPRATPRPPDGPPGRTGSAGALPLAQRCDRISRKAHTPSTTCSRHVREPSPAAIPHGSGGRNHTPARRAPAPTAQPRPAPVGRGPGNDVGVNSARRPARVEPVGERRRQERRTLGI